MGAAEWHLAQRARRRGGAQPSKEVKCRHVFGQAKRHAPPGIVRNHTLSSSPLAAGPTGTMRASRRVGAARPVCRRTDNLRLVVVSCRRCAGRAWRSGDWLRLHESRSLCASYTHTDARALLPSGAVLQIVHCGSTIDMATVSGVRQPVAKGSSGAKRGTPNSALGCTPLRPHARAPHLQARRVEEHRAPVAHTSHVPLGRK